MELEKNEELHYKKDDRDTYFLNTQFTIDSEKEIQLKLKRRKIQRMKKTCITKSKMINVYTCKCQELFLIKTIKY